MRSPCLFSHLVCADLVTSCVQPTGGETGLTGAHTVPSRTLRVNTSFVPPPPFFFLFFPSIFSERHRRCKISTCCSVGGLNFDALLIFTRHEAAARQNGMILDTELFYCCCCCFIYCCYCCLCLTRHSDNHKCAERETHIFSTGTDSSVTCLITASIVSCTTLRE